jgi:hypothetical protein
LRTSVACKRVGTANLITSYTRSGDERVGAFCVNPTVPNSDIQNGRT